MEMAVVKRTRIIIVITALVTGLLFVQFAVRPTPADRPAVADKVNLALRRTAHQLLAAAGDSTSKIPPVQQTDANTFVVRFERSFRYDDLPTVLQTSFQRHGITADYDVSLRDCASGQLQLGYTFRDLTEKNGVPCQGREQQNGCYNLQVRFSAPEASAPAAAIWGLLAVGSVLAGLVFLTRRKKAETPEESSPETGEKIAFGNSSLDVANLNLTAGSIIQSLTYREAKLLRFFAEHPNQLLERERILKAIWEDEGVIVGRSLDVFVSRLRKLIQGDSTVRIVAVHGVGYRLEIRPNDPAGGSV